MTDLAAALTSQDVSSETRRRAATSLGALASVEAVEALIAGLDCSDSGAVHAVVDALGDVGPAAGAAAPHLVATMRRSDAETRRRAVLALQRIDPDHPVPVGLMLGDVQSPGEPAPGGRALPDAVLDNVPTLIARVDREERYTYVNRAYAEWVGRTAGDIVGRTVADIHAPDIYANMSAHLRQALDGRPQEFDAELRLHDTWTRQVRARYVPDLGDDGTVQGVYALVNDVTDLARTVEELRASEGRLRRIVGAIPDTTLRLSSDGSILDFASTTDDDAQQFVGSNVSVLVRNKDLGDVMTCISRAIATGEIQRQDLRAFEGGELRHFECRSARVNEQEVFVIVRDVTDIRQLEDDLRALNQQLEERVEDRTAALERESASRRDTSQALRERAEELDRVLRNAKCIFWRSTIVENENGRLIWTPTRTDDPVYRAVLPLNIPPGRTYIEAWRDAIAPADRDAMDRTGNDAIREGRDQYQQAFTCTDAHGRPRRIQEDVSIKRTGPGRWEAAGVARDVTSLTDAEAVQQQLEERIADRAAALAREVAARRDASEALRARAEELDRVLRDAKCILWRSEVVQGDDGTLNWTPKRMDAPNFLAVLPLAVKRGQTHLEAWGEAVMPADRRRLNRIRTDAVLEGRDRYQYEYGCVVESGEVRRMHEDVSVRRIGPSRWEAVGVARDVTSFAAAEAIQHELEQRFRAVFDNSPVGMLIRNRNLVVTHANKALCDMLGYTLEELRELDIAAIADPEEHTTDNRRLSVELLEGVRDSYEVERRHLRKNGESFWVRLRVYAVRDDNGEFVYTVAMQEDISDRKAAEAAIQAHEHERTQLLQRIVDVQEEERARISFELHDQIGQQLTSLLLGLRAAEAATDLTVMKQQTAELRTETTEAVEAVRQMAFDMRPGTLDDLGVVTALRRDVENIARSAGFHAVFRVYDEDRLRLSSDAEVALYRVVNAALTNIVQHARASNVSVNLQPQDTDALVMVEDDGVGFDTEAAMAGPVEARFGLLGMQERMASVGGRVNVESTPGEGTATFITLPLEPEG